MTVKRRKPEEAPVDPEVAEELRAADAEAREVASERRAELLKRLREL